MSQPPMQQQHPSQQQLGLLQQQQNPNLQQLQRGQPLLQQQQQQQQQQSQQQQPQGPQEDRLVTRARELVSGPLKQKWAETLREAANQLYQNGLPDSVPNPANRFEMKLEDFYAVCDQIELNLKCALECHQQTAASTRYMPIPPIPSRMDVPASGNVEFLNYPQYIATAKQQIQFSQEVRQVLNSAAKDVTDRAWS